MAITVEDIKPSGLRERNTKGTARVPQIERELDVLLCLRACCTPDLKHHDVTVYSEFPQRAAIFLLS